MNNDNSNKKIISLALVIVGFVVALVVEVIVEALAVSFGAVARLREIDFVNHGLPVVVGLVTFLIMQFHPQVQVWADEVITEVRKVVWPSRKDTTGMTIVVCILVVIAGIGFGIFDFLSSQILKMFVH